MMKPAAASLDDSDDTTADSERVTSDTSGENCRSRSNSSSSTIVVSTVIGSVQVASSENSNDQPSSVTSLVWIRNVIRTFGTPLLSTISAVYAIQGFKSFSSIATSYLFKDTFNLNPAESQLLLSTTLIPWSIKPLYGLLSDSFPLCGSHRKSYLALASAAASLAYVALASQALTSSATSATIALVITNLSLAINDVVIDAKVVEASRLDPSGNGANDLQTISWTSMSLGGIIGSVSAGPILSAFNNDSRIIFAISVTGPLVILILALCFMKETNQTSTNLQQNNLFKTKVKALIKALRVPTVWKTSVWIIISGSVAPSYGQVSFYFATDVLHFTPEFLGSVSAIGYGFLMVGTILYNSYFRKADYKNLLKNVQICLAVVSALDIILVTRANLKIGIPDEVFVVGDEIISDVFGRLKTMPMLVLCAKICPPGVEGTLFALLMSISNFSMAVSSYFGAIICDTLSIEKGSYDNLWIAIVIRSVLKVVPVFLMFLLPDKNIAEDKESDNEKDLRVIEMVSLLEETRMEE